MKLEQYMSISGVDMDAMRETYREAAKRDVLTEILLDEIAQVEDIKADNQEVNYEIAYLASLYRTTPKQIVKVLTDNRQVSSVVANVRRRKVMKFIVDNMAQSETVAEEKTEAPAEAPVEKKVEAKVDDKKSDKITKTE